MGPGNPWWKTKNVFPKVPAQKSRRRSVLLPTFLRPWGNPWWRPGTRSTSKKTVWEPSGVVGSGLSFVPACGCDVTANSFLQLLRPAPERVAQTGVAVACCALVFHRSGEVRDSRTPDEAAAFGRFRPLVVSRRSAGDQRRSVDPARRRRSARKGREETCCSERRSAVPPQLRRTCEKLAGLRRQLPG